MTPRTAILLPFLLCLVFSPRSRAGEDGFVRLTGDRNVLQTAIRTYAHPARVSLTLVGTVHIGSAEYFSQIQSNLAGFDSVLIEGIRRASNATRIASHDYAPTLGLVQQTNVLRLNGPNIIGADMDAAAFDRLHAQSNPDSPAASPPVSRAELADGLNRLATDPQTLDATVRAYAIRERNEIVIQSLRYRLARGDSSIALVYGVAHGPDLHERLLKLGFTVQSAWWVDAFDLSP